MTRMLSIEKACDFIYRFEIKQGAPLRDPNAANLLAFEQFIGPTAGAFHSVDGAIGQRHHRADTGDRHQAPAHLIVRKSSASRRC